MPLLPVTHLFVYGSLRRQTIGNTGLAGIFVRHTRFIGNGFMQGQLYEVNAYPGAICSQNRDEKIYGEIYRLLDANALLAALDQYEECTVDFPSPHEFIRRRMPIQLVGGNLLSAWVYLYNRDVAGLKRISSGDYFLQ